MERSLSETTLRLGDGATTPGESALGGHVGGPIRQSLSPWKSRARNINNSQPDSQAHFAGVTKYPQPGELGSLELRWSPGFSRLKPGLQQVLPNLACWLPGRQPVKRQRSFASAQWRRRLRACRRGSA